MGRRAYGQYCGLARAVELIGERWALLIVRDLMVAPRRYVELHRGLPRIPTNVLASRLKELEASGVIARRVLPRPASGVVYELTEWGRELEPAVIALSRWGAQSLGSPRPGEIATPGSMIMAMRSTFRSERARGLTVDYQLNSGGINIQIRIDDGRLAVTEGTLPDADLVIEAGAGLRPLIAGEVEPATAVREGSVQLTGDPALLDRFVEVFRI